MDTFVEARRLRNAHRNEVSSFPWLYEHDPIRFVSHSSVFYA